MKNLVAILTVLSLIAVGTVAFGHSTGSWEGDMMGQGGHMMGQGGFGYGNNQKFLNETAELRKELHDKKFDYFEAVRNPDTTTETITKLEREAYELQKKINEKMPRTAYSGFGGFSCW